MRTLTGISLSLLMLLCSCDAPYKRGKKGLEYKIIAEGKGDSLRIGQFMQVHIRQMVNNGKSDSLLNDTRTNGSPIIEPFDSSGIPPEYIDILTQVRRGDSLVMRVLVDSMFAQSPGAMPPFFKKGYRFVTTVKMVNIFANRAQADSAMAAEMKEQARKDSIENISILARQDKELQAYFKKNKIRAEKTELGTYVELIRPGTGPLIDTNVVVKTNYTGRTLDGKMFDSNTDSSMGHVQPFSVNMTSELDLGGSVIKGWLDGLKKLNKGAQARLYIPSPLAYGKQKVGEKIPAHSILMFDIEVLDITDRALARLDVEKKMRFKEERRKRYLDSMAKVQPKTKDAKK